MADDKDSNPPSLFLFPTKDALALDALRPVPITASLFPQEEGEADSFLGQTETVDQQSYQPTTSNFAPSPETSIKSQFSAASFFQSPAGPPTSSVSSDSFVNISHSSVSPLKTSQDDSIPLMVPHQQPLSSMYSSPQVGPATSSLDALSGPQGFHLSDNVSSSTGHYGHEQLASQGLLTQEGPPIADHYLESSPGAHSHSSLHGGPSYNDLPPNGPSPIGPPPIGPPPSGQPVNFGMRGFQHKPMAHPTGPTATTTVGPSVFLNTAGQPGPSLTTIPQFDINNPPPRNAELQDVNIHPPFVAGGEGIQTHYRPVLPHWFFCKLKGNIETWFPFSTVDSSRLEEAYLKGQQYSNEIILSSNGGRYDINLRERLRSSIYWEETPSKVRRCTWFFKSDGENKFLPYEEELASTLEEEYKSAALQNLWNRRLELPGGEAVVMHNPNVIVHFRPCAKRNEWGNMDSQIRPRVVKRGVDDIEDVSFGESDKVDHLVFVVHGIGPVCDLRFRSIVECVEDFRSVSLNLMQSHFSQAVEDGRAARVEFLPVYWYDALHGDATGVDSKLKRITLPSILRLRRFTNDTLLDILFYSSPAYCQQIAEVVAGEMNRLYELFEERNPSFNGQTSIIGHSLGSLISFDLLSHQGLHVNGDQTDKDQDNLSVPGGLPQELTTDDSCNSSISNMSISNVASEDELGEDKAIELEKALEQLGMSDLMPKFEEERIDMEALIMCDDSELKELGIPLGPRKKLKGFLKQQAGKKERRKQQVMERARLEAEKLAQIEAAKAQLEQSQSLNGIAESDGLTSSPSMHVDYEIGRQGIGQPSVKYPLLNVHPASFFAMGSPIGMFLTVRGLDTVGELYRLPTCPAFFNIFHPFDPVAYRIEPLVNPSLADVKPVLMPHHKGRKRFHLELKESLTHFGADLKKSFIDSMRKTWRTLHEFALAHRGTEEGEGAPAVTDAAMEVVADKLSKEKLVQIQEEAEQVKAQRTMAEADLKLGQLNGGRRIDYVLQEAPFESFNEYLFALGSHTCYWESEDSVLMVLKEIYGPLGIYSNANNLPMDSEPPTPNQY